MFCPRCSTQNELTQNYCRKCGQFLGGARLDLEGTGIKSLETAREGEKWIRNGSITLIIFSVIALIVAITTMIITGLATPTILSIIVDLVLGLAIGLPLILVGNTKLKRANRLFADQQEGAGNLFQDRTEPAKLTAGLRSELQNVPAPGSVTEHTTLDLERAERARRPPNSVDP